jgi:hypothetical protein
VRLLHSREGACALGRSWNRGERGAAGLSSFVYCHAEAERYAGGELIPADLLDPVAGRPDHELADSFGVPLEQIRPERAHRRRR